MIKMEGAVLSAVSFFVPNKIPARKIDDLSRIENKALSGAIVSFRSLDDRIPRPWDLGRRVGDQEVYDITASMVLDIAVGIWCGEDDGHPAEDHLEALAGQFDVRTYQDGRFYLYNGKSGPANGHGRAFYDHL
jgi:hypothetical protein